eukprot:Phypoly_transcript_07277.p1 GENE.Phypoly_transcript_07277~~Phypoly_transcript_07277.p1  ORF type:complete len:507 (+),score=93.38 Phypoly_transcript_07277:66-1586(+)
MSATASQQQLLLQAARDGDKEIAIQLLVDGADQNGKDALGYTPLMWAVYYNRVEIVEILLYYNVNLNAKSKGGFTAMHVAVSKGSTACVSLLCKSGANLSSRSNTGYTPLHEGSNSGKLDSIKILLDYKAQINLKTSEGFTCLHLAAAKGNLEICQLLLDNGSAIEFTDSAGRTALHLAASCPHGKPVVDLLLARGANAAKKCMKNMTPMQYAVEFNCTLSISILQLAEGKAKVASTPEPKRPVPDLVIDKSNYADPPIFGSPGWSPGPNVEGPSSQSSSRTASPNLQVGPNATSPSVPTGPEETGTTAIGPNIFGPTATGPTVSGPNGTSSHASDTDTPQPGSTKIDAHDSESWAEMERSVARKNKLIEQLRAEKANAENHYTQSLKQLVQEIQNLEEKLRTSQTELETARAAQKELETTRKKIDSLLNELRTVNARHARLCEHVAEMEENRLCKVCFERPIGTVLSPCSHCCLCVECTTAVEKKNKKCPICRNDIEKSTLCYFT